MNQSQIHIVACALMGKNFTVSPFIEKTSPGFYGEKSEDWSAGGIAKTDRHFATLQAAHEFIMERNSTADRSHIPVKLRHFDFSITEQRIEGLVVTMTGFDCTSGQPEVSYVTEFEIPENHCLANPDSEDAKELLSYFQATCK